MGTEGLYDMEERSNGLTNQPYPTLTYKVSDIISANVTAASL